jgi:hypothetical protein
MSAIFGAGIGRSVEFNGLIEPFIVSGSFIEQ